MNYVIAFFKSTMFKRFAWTTLAGFLGLAVVFIGNIDWIYAPIVIAVISGITKEINKYLSE